MTPSSKTATTKRYTTKKNTSQGKATTQERNRRHNEKRTPSTEESLLQLARELQVTVIS